MLRKGPAMRIVEKDEKWCARKKGRDVASLHS